jgi:hypothetical protein
VSWGFDPRLTAVYALSVLDVVEIDNRSLVIVYANHQPWYATFIGLLDPSDRSIVQSYWHPGRFYAAERSDIDRDGMDELLLGGINNPGKGMGHPALVVLDLPMAPNGYSGDRLFGDEFALEKRYILFPRYDIADATGRMVAVKSVTVSGATIRASVGSLYMYGHYDLDHELGLVRFTATDDARMHHTELQNSGQLDHDLDEAEIRSWGRLRYFPTAPDGNSAEVATEFAGLE